MLIELDEQAILTVKAALRARRAEAKRDLANSKRKGFRPMPGHVDINLVKIRAADRVLALLEEQLMKEGQVNERID